MKRLTTETHVAVYLGVHIALARQWVSKAAGREKCLKRMGQLADFDEMLGRLDRQITHCAALVKPKRKKR